MTIYITILALHFTLLNKINLYYDRSYTSTETRSSTWDSQPFCKLRRPRHCIESYWAKFKVMKGVAADSLPSYLDKRMWRDRWGATTKDAFESICNFSILCKDTAAESQTNSPFQG